MNASRFITNSISYEARQGIHNELSRIQENYGKVKSEKQHKSHSHSPAFDSDESPPSDEKISRFWVAVDKRSGNRVIGFLALKDEEIRRRKVLEHEPQIRYLCVDTNYMRRGVATLLIEHAIKFAHKKQVARIGVTISTWYEPAKELFYRFGFVEIMREAMTLGFNEKVKLSLDVESWNRYRKARKSAYR
ncbi:5691_t:CDS:1 [Acaulospora colombiana]|uniref:5691_t:CDS:1 n=1 Tax=Acaulospora colombiana TaxID=27376 RepID=A0ACA9MTD2_9GLOM|nr:5691_t:CDS:1 [Acaulospora colombiana]